MQTIIAAGLIALAAQAGTPDARDRSPPTNEIAGKALKDTPDGALREALADPGTTEGLRSGIRREIALRDEWRRKEGRTSYRNGLYWWDVR